MVAEVLGSALGRTGAAQFAARLVGRGGLAAAAVVLLHMALAAQPAQAAKVDCGDMISQDTKVGNDLKNCPGHGLVIDTDDVTLDLNGHTIDGDNSGGGNGILVEDNLENVIVKNGKVRQFAEGLQIQNTGTGHRVLNLKLVENTNDGLQIEDNVNRTLVRGVQALDNDDGGFDVDGPSTELIFQSNSAENNANSHGYEFDDTDNSLVERSSAKKNASDGINFDSDSTGNLIRTFTAQGNDDGLEIDGSANTLEEVRAGNNDESGIGIGGGDNKVLDSLATDNAFEGIRVESGATGTLLSGNTANHNDQDGIEVNDAATTLRRNTAKDNGFLGIDATAGVTDLGGNKAKGNDGAPPQCNNVEC